MTDIRHPLYLTVGRHIAALHFANRSLFGGGVLGVVFGGLGFGYMVLLFGVEGSGYVLGVYG